jgi:hypothetical protein
MWWMDETCQHLTARSGSFFSLCRFPINSSQGCVFCVTQSNKNRRISSSPAALFSFSPRSRRHPQMLMITARELDDGPSLMSWLRPTAASSLIQTQKQRRLVHTI